MVTRTSSPTSKTSARESPRGAPVSNPIRSSRSSAPSNRAPRGSASFSAPPVRAVGEARLGAVTPCTSTSALLGFVLSGSASLLTLLLSLLLRLGDVQPLEVEREPGRLQRSPEPAHELVIPPAATEDVTERRVV